MRFRRQDKYYARSDEDYTICVTYGGPDGRERKWGAWGPKPAPDAEGRRSEQLRPFLGHASSFDEAQALAEAHLDSGDGKCQR